jgi:hypothetical protein
MPYLPARPDLEQVRHQAKDLLREGNNADANALRRIPAVSDRLILASTLLAQEPELAVSRMVHWADHRLGANSLNSPERAPANRPPSTRTRSRSQPPR